MCIRCYNINSLNWYYYDNIWWDERKIVRCCLKGENYSDEGVKVDIDSVPDCCPYKLEHMVFCNEELRNMQEM